MQKDFFIRRRNLIKDLQEKGIHDKAVLDAILKVKRHYFAPKNQIKNAYEDRPIPIGAGQVMSSPFIVAFMLQELELKKGQRVLEIGTGSGYKAAVISKITRSKVYTTEVKRELSEKALENIKRANLTKIKVLHRDGSIGYKTFAPYARIIITAAVSEIPPCLFDQLKPGGIIIAPIKTKKRQYLKKVRKIKKKLVEEDLGEFKFTEITGKFKPK